MIAAWLRGRRRPRNEEDRPMAVVTVRMDRVDRAALPVDLTLRVPEDQLGRLQDVLNEWANG